MDHRPQLRRGFLVLTLASLSLLSLTANAEESSAGNSVTAAQAAVNAGDFAASLPEWKNALDLYASENNIAGEIATSLNLANAYQALGQYRLAEETLNRAKDLSKKSANKVAEATIDTSLGALYTLSTDTDDADALLTQGLTLARQQRNDHAIAVALNNLANLHVYQKKYDAAASEYGEAFTLAERSHDRSLSLKVASNTAATALNHSDFATAVKWADVVMEKSAGLADGHEKAIALIDAGKICQDIFERDGSQNDKLRLKAFQAYQHAAAIAEKAGDKRAFSYALGYEGQLYEMQRSFADALALTRKATFLAQEIKAPDILFRWEAQSGRLLGETHDREAAIGANETAIETLQSIRHDLSLHYGNINYHSSFRAVAGPVFFALADLLLQRADDDKNEKDAQADLGRARDTMEDLKSAELEDYFQDDCANLLRSKITKVETISTTAAVIYIIPLLNRTEILVTLPTGKIERVKSEVTADQLNDTANQFRFNLEKRTTDEYLDQSRQLYDWLIRPLDKILAKSKTDTLVFVPDGALLTIPMSALNDGDQFLIEKYAIAAIPGMTLLDPKPLNEQHGTMVANGLSESVRGSAPLKYVPEEMKQLKALYGGPEYMNSQFVKSAVDKEFSTDSYSIVHIASHGHFDNDASKTFILTYDGQMNLDELERMIRPSQIRDKPVELLTLSACQTAAGDDRAALGLAGIAVKSGARAAFATLWFVNDETSAMLVGDFYTNLHNMPGITKAKALQRAQVKLLADPRYGHPCYWAPYLIIGNWL